MPGSKEEDFKRNNACSLYELYNHAQAQEPLPLGSCNLHFGRPFLGHHFYQLSLFDLCMGIEKIFKKYINFTLFAPKLQN